MSAHPTKPQAAAETPAETPAAVPAATQSPEEKAVQRLRKRSAELTRAGEFEAAAAVAKLAHERMPRDKTTLHNYAAALWDLRRRDDTVAALDRLLTEDPTYVSAHVLKGVVHLTCEEWADGWAHFEWRLKLPGVMRKDLPPGRDWKGPAAGRNTGRPDIGEGPLMVVGEQGIGDTIQFLRYGPYLKAQGLRVHLNIMGPLRDLLAHNPQVGDLIERGQGVELKAWAQAVSLPGLMGHGNHEATPTSENGAYLKAPSGPLPEPLQAPGRVKVGLAWAGNPDHPRDWMRSAPLRAFKPLADVEGLRFYSLLPDTYAPEIAALGCETWLSDLSAISFPLDRLAKVIEAMDLVIAVDTGVAHLAAAMGKPVWLLLNAQSDWRWGLQGRTTPWYPSMRIYRAPRAGEWSGVIDEVVHSLTRALGRR